jgi:hypothetical protein
LLRSEEWNKSQAANILFYSEKAFNKSSKNCFQFQSIQKKEKPLKGVAICELSSTKFEPFTRRFPSFKRARRGLIMKVFDFHSLLKNCN